MTQYRVINKLSGVLRLRDDRGILVEFMPGEPRFLDDIKFIQKHPGIEITDLINVESRRIKKIKKDLRKYKKK